MSINIHIDRLVLDNAGPDAGDPQMWATQFSAALGDEIRDHAGTSGQTVRATDPAATVQSAAAAAARAIRTRIAAASARTNTGGEPQ
jgi:hypothetical protein